MVKIRLILESIIMENQLKPSPEKVQETIETWSKTYEKPEEYMRWASTEQKERERVEAYVLEKLAYETILEKVKIKEKKQSFDDVMNH